MSIYIAHRRKNNAFNASSPLKMLV